MAGILYSSELRLRSIYEQMTGGLKLEMRDYLMGTIDFALYLKTDPNLSKFLAPQHWRRIGDALRTHWERIWDLLGTHWGRIGDVLGTHWGRIGDALGTLLGGIDDTLGTH